MPRFPQKKAEIAAVAEQSWCRLVDNISAYRQPLVHPLLVRVQSMIHSARRHYLIAKQAVAECATTAKDEVLAELVEPVKTDVRYAANTVNYSDRKLKRIGWADQKAKTRLAPPGQVRLLQAPKQGESWVSLDWKAPLTGGKPRAYEVHRHLRPGGGWQDVATAVISEASLVGQPTGKGFEYRIIGVNRAGEGEPSNAAVAVL
jgi:hypothetical protein